jgi:Arc/MetJ-type ribon-helix-helix transcriptional regulator
MVKRTKDSGVKVGVKLPKKYVEIIDGFVKEGESLSRTHFVRKAVEWYLIKMGLIKTPIEDNKVSNSA